MRKKDDVIRKSRTASRSHFNGKNALTKFQWDSVDDQIQEDLIEPVASVGKKRAAKRRDKDVDTMYVSSSADVYAPVKKKNVKTLHAEDFAEFVAEVEENEDNPYAIPSYGQPRLTPDDEEFVEELAVPKKKPERRASEPVEKKRNPEKARREDATSTAPANQTEPAPKTKGKRSFLAKIKDAISISSGADAKEKSESAQDDRVERLTRATNDVVAQTNALASGAAQIDALLRAAQALASAAAAIQGVVSELTNAGPLVEAAKPTKKQDANARQAKKNDAPQEKQSQSEIAKEAAASGALRRTSG